MKLLKTLDCCLCTVAACSQGLECVNRGLLKFDPKVTLRPPGIEPRANPWKGFMLPLHQGRAVISCAQYAEMQYYNLNLISIHLCDYSTAGMGLGFYWKITLQAQGRGRFLFADSYCAQFTLSELSKHKAGTFLASSRGGKVLSEVDRGLHH